MKVRELIELLQQIDQDTNVLVEDVHAPRVKEFLGNYGFLPQIVCYQHDDGPIVVLVAAKNCKDPSIVHKDDRRYTRPRGFTVG
ncbi:MAG: hypothetical protein Q8L52_02460 [bacterium]|nr:hypothetical protein [bacterium]